MEQLGDDEIDAVLERIGYGILGLQTGAHPYLLPMSFGYDGEDLYFQMNSTGAKFGYIDEETLASLAVLDIDPETGTSRSVVVEGTMTVVPEDETMQAFESLADNAEFGTDITLWGVPLQDATPRLYVLRAESVSGRLFGEYG